MANIDRWSAPKQIRFVNNQGQPPSKRRRISAACLTCRRRKTRCAGEKPRCSTCTKNGHECLGYPDDGPGEDLRVDSTSLDEVREEFGGDDARDNSNVDPGKQVESTTKGIENTTKRIERPTRSAVVLESSKNNIQIPSKSPISRPAANVSDDTSPAHGSDRAIRNASISTSHDEAPNSPTLERGGGRASLAHRVPYFRYFGPTAIVPGFKQMVVSVKESRSAIQTDTSPSSVPSDSFTGSDAVAESLPTYDPNNNDSIPVHPLILHLVETFFLHVGCNFPFLKEAKFIELVKEKRVEAILVDAICALAGRFSDSPILTGGNEKMPRTERGHIYAQRAKQATVDTFPCPSVAAVQACLLLAYESFGANQDSALWMYLGLAIRMAVDLGLQKRVGIQYQGEKDPRNMNMRSRTARRSVDNTASSSSPEDQLHVDAAGLSLAEQKEVEQERIDTFWAVFVLDRVISSGTGRPVTFREDDFELPLPQPTLDPATGWPSLFPILVQIIHLYGRVSDVLNNIQQAQDLTQERWNKLTAMEQQLTRLYKSWDPRLQFNVDNFKAFLGMNQGNIFILLHFWFHALFIILHQPTLLTPLKEQRAELQLLSDSRELSMSSAKTICDILAFADLIDPKSFIGNPFTSQPIYIAAGAFLMESHSASSAPSREASPSSSGQENSRKNTRSSKHSLLASAANQNYQRCYNSLQKIHEFWGGIRYILTALDQKAKGLREVETFTAEEYEATKDIQRGGSSISGQLARLDPPAAVGSINAGPPIAWSLAGTAYSPNSNLTVMYHQTGNGSIAGPGVVRQLNPDRLPNNSVYGQMFPPAVPQPNTSAVRHSPRRNIASRESTIASNGMLQELFAFPSASQSYEGYNNASPSNVIADTNSLYYQGMAYQPEPWNSGGNGNMDAITFNSHDIDIGSLGLDQPDIMSGWLDYIPHDVLGLFDGRDIGQDRGS